MPSAMPDRGHFLATVAVNRPLCDEHFLLTLKLPRFPATAPGQFLQLACHDMNGDESTPQSGRTELLTPLAMLRRPFSLAGRRDIGNGVELDIIHRVVGVGTAWLSRLRIGERVSLLGPLGNTFTPSGADQRAILVGGGVGIPPMLYLAEKLAGRRVVAFCGALRRDLLPLAVVSEPRASGEASLCIAEFARHGIPTVVTTDDGSAGFRGLVTQALERS